MFSSIRRASSALIQRAPVHADPHRLIILDGNFDHLPEILIVLLSRRPRCPD